MPALIIQARPASPSRLAGCVGLALGLHIAVLAAVWHGGDPRIDGPTSRPTLLRLAYRPMAAAPVSETAVVDPSRRPEPTMDEPQAPAPPDRPPATSAAPSASHISEAPELLPEPADGPLAIPYPDAPLTTGRLQLRLRVGFNAAGEVAALDSDAGIETPAAFIQAIEGALRSTPFRPARLRQRAVAGTLCLRLTFTEGQATAELELLARESAEPRRCLGSG